MKRRYLLLFAPALLAACEDNPVEPTEQRDPCNTFLQSYATVNGDTLTTNEGVRYIDVVTGVGPAVTWGHVTLVDYSGYFASGIATQTNCALNNESLLFQLGDQRFPAGFQFGIIGMRLSGIRRIIIPLELGAEGDTEERVFDIHMLNVLN